MTKTKRNNISTKEILAVGLSFIFFYLIFSNWDLIKSWIWSS